MLQVAIVGAGFGGLGMAIQLARRGERRFVIFEKGDGVGGCWRDNTYPGAACDIPSHLYSFSFAPGHGWTRAFAPQPEILAYLKSCATEYGLWPHLRDRTEVRGARFDEAIAAWRIDLAGGEQVLARALVVATGQLSRPAYPDIAGRERFQGPAFHSARWDHAAPLDGRRIAVIGTGASAIQFVPAIAPRAGHMSLFQRTPPWVVPKPDRALPAWERALRRRIPAIDAVTRARIYATNELRAFTMEFPRLTSFYTWLASRQLREQIRDPELRRKLTPGYPIGCKRVLISNDFYPALARPNVEVITERITEITERGVVTDDGREREVDAIIYGTGFAANDFLAPMKISAPNPDGKDTALEDVWRAGAEAYLGITVAGFPNLFVLYGPNTNLGHNSIIYMLECQFAYVMQCLEQLHRVRTLTVSADVQRAYNAKLQQQLGESVWSGDCTSWYKLPDGKITNNWPGYTFTYRRRTRTLDLDDYRIAR